MGISRTGQSSVAHHETAYVVFSANAERSGRSPSLAAAIRRGDCLRRAAAADERGVMNFFGCSLGKAGAFSDNSE
jgi:hypothetical protein